MTAQRPADHRFPRRRLRAGTIALAAVAVGVLAGCGSTAEGLHAALGRAVSATASAELHTQQLRDGRAPASVAATGYDDAVTALTSAQDDVTAMRVDPSTRSQRNAALHDIRSAVDAVLGEQDALNSGRGRADADADLRDALRVLRSAERRVSS